MPRKRPTLRRVGTFNSLNNFERVTYSQNLNISKNTGNASSNVSGKSPQSNSKNIDFDKKVKKLEKQYMNIVKTQRTAVFTEASQFVKKQSTHISRLLTKEHHKIIDQYFELRDLN